jgi:hypothetical protein
VTTPPASAALCGPPRSPAIAWAVTWPGLGWVRSGPWRRGQTGFSAEVNPISRGGRRAARSTDPPTATTSAAQPNSAALAPPRLPRIADRQRPQRPLVSLPGGNAVRARVGTAGQRGQQQVPTQRRRVCSISRPMSSSLNHMSGHHRSRSRSRPAATSYTCWGSSGLVKSTNRPHASASRRNTSVPGSPRPDLRSCPRSSRRRPVGVDRIEAPSRSSIRPATRRPRVDRRATCTVPADRPARPPALFGPAGAGTLARP